MNARVKVHDTPYALAHAAASFLAASIEEAVEERGLCWIALPGGPIVRPIYAELAQFQLPWTDVMFCFTDERCVPPSHPASNYGEAIDKFLKNPRIGPHQFQRIEAELPDRELAAEEYARRLPEELDCALLVLGADGHVAGLWPGSPALEEREQAALAVQAPTRPMQRITLTPLALAAVRTSLIVATGRECAARVARALAPEGEPSADPARLFEGAVWMLDRPAAAGLGERARESGAGTS